MKRLPFVLVLLVFLSFWTNAQGLLQTSRKVNSIGTIEYSTQSFVTKRYTFNCYNIFDTTPQIYAGLYDMSVADWGANVRAGIAEVKAIKPDFKVLLYWNLRSTETWILPEYQTIVDNGWLLRDSSGNTIPADVGLLVDVGSSGYQNYIASALRTRINNYGYDGVYGDNSLFWGASELFWGCSATPINPRTNRPWTDVEARQALIGLHTAIKNAIGSRLLCCNGIYSGYRFYYHQSAFQEILSASPLDGFMSEGLWHPYVTSTPCIWMSETQWQQAVQFLIWVQDNFLSGHPERFYMPVAKLAYGNQNPTQLPSGCTREQMAKYAYTSLLLGIKNDQASQVFFGTNLNSAFCGSYMQPLYNAQIGTPTNDCYIVSGTHVYARDFSNGKILVNPTDQLYSVSLTRSYVTLEGQTVSSLNIKPHTGVVLKSSA